MSDVIERIEAFNQGRNAERLNIKYAMMRESRFAFMRATCHLYYEDWPKQSTLNNTPATWIAGDLHPLNFALYQGEDGQAYLDINDFDESILAPVRLGCRPLLDEYPNRFCGLHDSTAPTNCPALS